MKLFGALKLKPPLTRHVPTNHPVVTATFAAEKPSSALKIIHVGGTAEHYYMAVPAAQIIENYPSFILARPEIFRRPWDSIVRPEEILIPGQKYFIVPRGTVKKLRRRIRKEVIIAESFSNSIVSQCSSSNDIVSDDEIVNEKDGDVNSTKSFEYKSSGNGEDGPKKNSDFIGRRKRKVGISGTWRPKLAPINENPWSDEY